MKQAFLTPSLACFYMSENSDFLRILHGLCTHMWLVDSPHKNRRSLTGSPHKGPILGSFNISVVVSMNKLFNNQLNWRWFETLWCSCDVYVFLELTHRYVALAKGCLALRNYTRRWRRVPRLLIISCLMYFGPLVWIIGTNWNNDFHHMVKWFLYYFHHLVILPVLDA